MSELSLSALAGKYKDQKISRNMILQALVDCGYMADIRTITPSGRVAGISYKKNEKGQSWPVYGDRVQLQIEHSKDVIMEKYSHLYTPPKPKKSVPSDHASDHTPDR